LIRGDPALRVLVLTGAGGHFSPEPTSPSGVTPHATSRLQNHRIWEVFDELEKLDRPVIAAISGTRWAGVRAGDVLRPADRL